MIFTLICLCAISGYSQKREFNVEVEISAKNNVTKDAIESYITRELRTLVDVNIVTAKPLFSLRIVALDTGDQENPAGYALSVAATRNVACTVAGIRRMCEIFEDHALYVDKAENLRALCEEIVTDFDIRHLKDLRKK